MTPSTSSSSSTLIVDVSSLPIDTTVKKRPDLKLSISSGFIIPNKMPSGKGFIEPHRNNLPRRNKGTRRVVTVPNAPVVSPEMGKKNDDMPTTTTPSSPPIQTQTSPSLSDGTNITEPPSSLHASSSSSSSPAPAPPSNNNNNNKSPPPKRTIFRDHTSITHSSLVITPSKGHLQPTSATLPRRQRSLVLSAARKEEEKKRRSITDQQKLSGAERMRADEDDMCFFQELSKGVTLGFLNDDSDYQEEVQIKIYDSGSLAPSSTTTSHSQLSLSLPTHPSSYTDGTTSLSDSQIQQACTFIHHHLTLEPPGPSKSVVILSSRKRPEEAMSIGISYLAGIEEGKKGERAVLVVEEEEEEESSGTYATTTVHRLLIAFHDDSPGSPIPHDGSWRGLRPEWRGVLSFDGIQRLDGVWKRSLEG